MLIVQLAASSLLSAVVSLAVDGLPGTVGSVLCVAIVVAVVPLMALCRKRVEPYRVESDRGASFKETLRGSATPIMACAFFELITGLVNMYARHLQYAVHVHHFHQVPGEGTASAPCW